MDMRVDMCIATPADMRVDMCAGVSTDILRDLGPQAVGWEHPQEEGGLGGHVLAQQPVEHPAARHHRLACFGGRKVDRRGAVGVSQLCVGPDGAQQLAHV